MLLDLKILQYFTVPQNVLEVIIKDQLTPKVLYLQFKKNKKFFLKILIFSRHKWIQYNYSVVYFFLMGEYYELPQREEYNFSHKFLY